MRKQTKTTFINFLMENEFADEDLFHPTHSPLLERCKPFIEQCIEPLSKGSYLVRGMGNLKVDNAIKQIRSNRIPVDTPRAIHDMMNDSFRHHFGTAYRGDVLFCSKNRKNTHYGNRYAIFPIGKYTCVYSHHIDDMYDELFSGFARAKKGIVGTDAETIHKILTSHLTPEQMSELSKDTRYDFGRGQNSEKILMYDIITYCSSGSFDYQSDVVDDRVIEQIVKTFLDEIIKMNYIETTNLHDYLNDSSLHSNEAMIKCNSYIAVDIEKNSNRVKLDEFLKGVYNDLSNKRAE